MALGASVSDIFAPPASDLTPLPCLLVLPHSSSFAPTEQSFRLSHHRHLRVAGLILPMGQSHSRAGDGEQLAMGLFTSFPCCLPDPGKSLFQVLVKAEGLWVVDEPVPEAREQGVQLDSPGNSGGKLHPSLGKERKGVWHDGANRRGSAYRRKWHIRSWRSRFFSPEASWYVRRLS